MKIPITLAAPRLINHNEIITLPEDKVELDIIPTCYSVGTIIVSLRHGSEEKQYKYAGKPIDISSLCTRAGVVDISISLTANDEVLRDWQVMPLCIKEIPGGFEAIPALVALEERVAEVEKAIAELAEITT